MCSLPALAASAAKKTVAAGAVKSTMPSALSISAPASPTSLTPFSGMPASVPASQPISGERASSSAPASAKPLVSAMALTSVRPIRPPAPVTIKRMSAIVKLPVGFGIAGRLAPCHLSQRERSARVSTPGEGLWLFERPSSPLKNLSSRR
jgi:hypothetical protein